MINIFKDKIKKSIGEVKNEKNNYSTTCGIGIGIVVWWGV
jgi:hypothetical protein